MSDTFDHELDAFEQAEVMGWQLDYEVPVPTRWGRQRKRKREGRCSPAQGWNCPHCAAWHPMTHQKCWYCNDGKKEGYVIHGRTAD